jgi:Raf kinase inhibitor-like YbhB/YbcL family protein
MQQFLFQRVRYIRQGTGETGKNCLIEEWTASKKAVSSAFQPAVQRNKIWRMVTMRELVRAAMCAAALSVTSSVVLAQSAPPPARRVGMTMTSPSFTDGGVFPDPYTMKSATPVSPALAWENAPANTVSFTLIYYDQDELRQNNSADVVHWMIFNIPGTLRALPEGVGATAPLPDGAVQLKNASGKVDYMPPGMGCCVYHHYTFQLYALDTSLSLGPDATRADVQAAMDGHVLAKTTIGGRFHR